MSNTDNKVNGLLPLDGTGHREHNFEVEHDDKELKITWYKCTGCPANKAVHR